MVNFAYGLQFFLFIVACIAEFRNPTKRLVSSTGRNIYGESEAFHIRTCRRLIGLSLIAAMPINGPATADGAEWTCSYRGLVLVTQSMRYISPRESIDTAWAAGCSSQSIQAFSGAVCIKNDDFCINTMNISFKMRIYTTFKASFAATVRTRLSRSGKSDGF